MKSNAVPSFYFSGYPLHALKLPPSEQQIYLVQSENSDLKVHSNLRVLPIVNPYEEEEILSSQESNNSSDNKETEDISWFSNYE